MSNDTTRDAFEAEANKYDLDLNRFKEGYSDTNTDYGWLFWQAATEQGKRQPLTDEQIAGKWRAAYLSSKAFTTLDTYTYFAREIEAAHGITATPQGKPS